MISRSPNGFLSALSADDFELVRPHLRTVELTQELVLIEAGETLKRADLMRHRESRWLISTTRLTPL